VALGVAWEWPVFCTSAAFSILTWRAQEPRSPAEHSLRRPASKTGARAVISMREAGLSLL